MSLKVHTLRVSGYFQNMQKHITGERDPKLMNIELTYFLNGPLGEKICHSPEMKLYTLVCGGLVGGPGAIPPTESCERAPE